jgi:hypothetical protein
MGQNETNPPTEQLPTPSPNEGVLFAALFSHAIHQDQLLWGRVKLLVAVQGAVLLGSYHVRHHWLALALLSAGAVLTLLLRSLVEKDILDEQVNRDAHDALSDRLLPKDIRDLLERSGRSRPWIRFTSSAKGCLVLPGTLVLRLALWLFFALDILLIVLYASAPELF